MLRCSFLILSAARSSALRTVVPLPSPTVVRSLSSRTACAAALSLAFSTQLMSCLSFCLYLFKSFHSFEDFFSDGLDLFFSLVSRLLSRRLLFWRSVFFRWFCWFGLSWGGFWLSGFGFSRGWEVEGWPDLFDPGLYVEEGFLVSLEQVLFSCFQLEEVDCLLLSVDLRFPSFEVVLVWLYHLVFFGLVDGAFCFCFVDLCQRVSYDVSLEVSDSEFVSCFRYI